MANKLPELTTSQNENEDVIPASGPEVNVFAQKHFNSFVDREHGGLLFSWGDIMNLLPDLNRAFYILLSLNGYDYSTIELAVYMIRNESSKSGPYSRQAWEIHSDICRAINYLNTDLPTMNKIPFHQEFIRCYNPTYIPRTYEEYFDELPYFKKPLTVNEVCTGYMTEKPFENRKRIAESLSSWHKMQWYRLIAYNKKKGAINIQEAEAKQEQENSAPTSGSGCLSILLLGLLSLFCGLIAIVKMQAVSVMEKDVSLQCIVTQADN